MQITPRTAIPVTDTKIIDTPGNGSITQNNYFGSGAIAESVATVPTPPQGGFDWLGLSVFLGGLGIVAAAFIGFAWMWGQAVNEWNAEKEVAAQLELQRLQTCLNPANY